MTIIIEFETIIVCRQILELRFKGGWAAWLKNFSMEDDGELSRISAMSGLLIAEIEEKIQILGLLPPKITDTTYQYRDYFIYAMEYNPYEQMNLAPAYPDWLIWNASLMETMSLFEIDKLPLGTVKGSPARPTFDFNSKVTIT